MAGGLHLQLISFGIGHPFDRLGFTFGLQDLGLAVAVGVQNGGPLLPLGFHLPVHRFGDVRRRINALDLHPHDAYTPFVGGVVQHLAQFGVDMIAAGQGRVQFHLANHVTKVGLGQFGGRVVEISHIVDQLDRVRGLKVDDRINRDHHIVLRDHLLRWHVHDLFSHVHLLDSIDKGDNQGKTRLDGALEAPQPLYDAFLIRLHDANACKGNHDHKHCNNDQKYNRP